MATTPIPNMNPTGVIGSGYWNQPMAGQGSTAFSTGTGGPGTMGFGNSMNANPTVPGQSGNTAANPFIAQASQQGGNPQQPTLSKNGSGVNSANNAYGQTSSQQYWTQDYLEKSFPALLQLRLEKIPHFGWHSLHLPSQGEILRFQTLRSP